MKSTTLLKTAVQQASLGYGWAKRHSWDSDDRNVSMLHRLYTTVGRYVFAKRKTCMSGIIFWIHITSGT